MQEMQEMQFNPRVGKIPWSGKWQPTPVTWGEKPHGQRTLANYSPRGCKDSHVTEPMG